MNEMHEANRKRWDTIADIYKVEHGEGWDRSHTDPALAFEGESLGLLRKYAGDLSGKDAVVLGSGDNKAAFALAGMGAKATSVDISQRQLDVAAERAATLGLAIDFVQGDVTDLPMLPSGVFDFACSTRGVMVWITEPAKYYAEACRLLRPGGIFMSRDIHPFQRPWAEPEVGRLEMSKPYFDSGPRETIYNPEEDKNIGWASEVSADERAGMPSSFHCSWTISELVTALLDSGLELLHLGEEPESDLWFWQGDSAKTNAKPDLLDWRKNPRAGLPVWLTLIGKKRG